jgi:L-ascorbate metabolism protein UlaG (beta-lactamase superfamily)/rhodanese-related sulfurtransferase
MITLFSTLFCGCGGGNNSEQVTTMGVEEFASTMVQKDVRLIDVRTPKEYAEGHLAGSENIDVKAADFAERIKDIKGKVAVYCRGGRRSLKAAEQLAANGCTVYNLDGGILAWQKAGKPTTTVESDIFTTQSGKLVKFHALLHSSIRIEYDGREIEIDPCSNLRGRTVDYSCMPKADILLVTHEHFDHYDTAALRLLTSKKTQLVMNGRCVEMYGAGTIMTNGDKLQLADDIMLEAVPAYNTTEGHLQFHPKGRDNGYILTLDGMRIYIAGDTEDIPEMDNIKDIDIAFLPCNQPYTMTLEQLISAAKRVQPKVLFPYHYGETDISGIPAQLPGIDVRIRHYE